MLLDKTINDNSPVVLVWFRNNLRIGDNPSLDIASKSNSKIVPFFVWPGDSKYDTPVPNRASFEDSRTSDEDGLSASIGDLAPGVLGRREH